MSILDEFLGAAKAKVDEVNNKYLTRPTDTTSGIGGSIFEAIYQFGRGAADKGRESLAKSFLGTTEGQKLAAAVEQERIKQYTPYLIGGAVLIVGGLFLLRR